MHETMTRLYEAAKTLKNTEGQTAVATLLGEIPQTVNNWERRGISTPGLIKAQENIGCSVVWLKTGKGPMTIEANTNVDVMPIGSIRIPLVSYVQAGNMREAVDSYPVGGAAEWLLTDLDLSSSSFALRIKGDSMLPEFKEGDAVIIDPAVQPLPGDFVVAKNGENEATFKKYRPRGINEHGNHVFELVPLNDDYESMRSDIIPISIIGTMIEHRRYRKR